jgi:acetylglutamate kinase
MEQLPPAFFEAVAALQRSGNQIVIVHGGGPAINALLNKLSIQPQFVEGLRVTCEDTMEVVEMVLAGSINKKLVRRLLEAGGRAWGISGIDGRLLTARRTEKPLGLVGEIEGVNTAAITSMLTDGYVPVIAPLGVSADGKQAFNLNADTAAGAIASALGADKLLMVTDVPGILQTMPGGGKSVLPEAGAAELEKMIEIGEIYGGMIPKVRAALDALYQGVKEVVICQGAAGELFAACEGKQVGTSIKEQPRKGVSV